MWYPPSQSALPRCARSSLPVLFYVSFQPITEPGQPPAGRPLIEVQVSMQVLIQTHKVYDPLLRHGVEGTDGLGSLGYQTGTSEPKPD